jgi:TP901 family phage tail tape measure protein
MDVGNLRIVIGADVGGLRTGLREAENGLKSVAKKAGAFGKQLGEGLKSAGDTMTGLGTSIGTLIAPLAGFGVAGVMVAADFESSMNEISARTGIVGEDLDMIRQFALKMGADTAFSAQQASDAFLQLLSSGSSAAEAMATLPAVLDLAAASGMDLGVTADVLTDILAQFGLSVSKVPENFLELQTQLGVTDQMMTDFGNDADATEQMLALADSLGVTTDQLYEMWNAAQPLTDEITLLANNLGIGADDWAAYGESVSNITPEIQALIDQTGLAGHRLAQMFTGVDPTWFTSSLTDAAKVADLLTQAAGASSASVEDLAQGFANVGPVANLFGMNVEETAAALAVLAENGIKGAEGGTALKSMLLSLTTPSAAAIAEMDRLGISLSNVDGSMKDLDTVIDELDAALDGLPMDEQIRVSALLAGSYGITALSALRTADGIDTMQLAMVEAAGAQEVAAARMKGFSGATDALTGSFETLMINALTPFMENTLTPMVQKITGVVNKIGEWAKANPDVANTVFVVTAAIAGLSAALITGGLAVSAMGTAVGGLGTALTFAFGPLGILIGGIGVLAVTIGTLLPGIVESWGAAFAEIGKFIQHVIDQVTALLAKIGEVAAAIPGMQMSSGDSNRQSFQGLWDAHGSHATGLANVPFDGYRAILHKGERVMTAHENRSGGSGGVMINFNGGNFLGSRQEVIEWVREGMAEAGL